MTVVKRDTRRSSQRKAFDDYSVLLDLDMLRESVQMAMYGDDIFHAAGIELEQHIPGLLILLAVARYVERVLHRARTIMESVRRSGFSSGHFRMSPLNFQEVSRELIAIQLLEADARELEEEFAEAYALINDKYSLTAFTPTKRGGNYSTQPLSGVLSSEIRYFMDRAGKILQHIRTVAEAMSRHSLERRSRNENRSLLGLTAALLALGGVGFWFQADFVKPLERALVLVGAVVLWVLSVALPRLTPRPIRWTRRLLNLLRQRHRSIW
jgi:hypothetical protein